MLQVNQMKVSIKDLFAGYCDDGESGCSAYSGLLNVRPAYQREFVYSEEQSKLVIDSIINGLPINVFYWGKATLESYELIDGQQRTISICRFLHGDFSIPFDGRENVTFINLPKEVQIKILKTDLDIFVCEGTETERLNWFRRINTAQETLTAQELRNAVYTGPWLSDAKKYFSKTRCAAERIGGEFLEGSSIRQDWLEEVISWIADKDNLSIEAYMQRHRFDTNANELKQYFEDVIKWVRTVFGQVMDKDMKRVHWGIIYNKYHDSQLMVSPEKVATRVRELRDDDEVTRNAGIYEFIASGEQNQKCLNLRKFPEKIARKIYSQQGGKCKYCGMAFPFEQMEADHVVPWSKGGRTMEGNCQMLCMACNRRKSNR